MNVKLYNLSLRVTHSEDDRCIIRWSRFKWGQGNAPLTEVQSGYRGARSDWWLWLSKRGVEASEVSPRGEELLMVLGRISEDIEPATGRHFIRQDATYALNGHD